MELLKDPFKGVMMVVVPSAKDVVSPLAEIGIFLIEKMEFILKELVEMQKRENGWWLLGWVDSTAVEVGLDGAIGVGVAEVYDKGIGMSKR